MRKGSAGPLNMRSPRNAAPPEGAGELTLIGILR